MAQEPPLNPGDEAEPGTPGSGAESVIADQMRLNRAVASVNAQKAGERSAVPRVKSICGATSAAARGWATRTTWCHGSGAGTGRRG